MGWKEDLTHPRSTIRRKATQELGGRTQTDPLVVPTLMKTLAGDHSPMVRAYAAHSLGKKKDSATISALLAALHDEALPVRAKAINALVKIDPSRTTVAHPLQTLLQTDPAPTIRACVLAALVPWYEPEKLDLILTALQDPSPLVYGLAARKLIGYEDRQVIEPLLMLLHTRPHHQHVIRALGYQKDPRIVSALLALLWTYPQKRKIQGAIFEALGNLGDSRALEPLLFFHSRQPTNRRIVGALATLKRSLAVTRSHEP